MALKGLILLGVTIDFNIPIHPFPSLQCGLRNYFESIIFILQNPQKDIQMKIYLSISKFSLITKTTSTNPSHAHHSRGIAINDEVDQSECKMIQKENIASDCAKPGEENVAVIYRLPRNSVERPPVLNTNTNQPTSKL